MMWELPLFFSPFLKKGPRPPPFLGNFIEEGLRASSSSSPPTKTGSITSSRNEQKELLSLFYYKASLPLDPFGQKDSVIKSFLWMDLHFVGGLIGTLEEEKSEKEKEAYWKWNTYSCNCKETLSNKLQTRTSWACKLGFLRLLSCCRLSLFFLSS